MYRLDMIRQALAEGTPMPRAIFLILLHETGVCVGYAVYGAAVAIAPLQEDGTVASEMTHEPGCDR